MNGMNYRLILGKTENREKVLNEVYESLFSKGLSTWEQIKRDRVLRLAEDTDIQCFIDFVRPYASRLLADGHDGNVQDPLWEECWHALEKLPRAQRGMIKLFPWHGRECSYWPPVRCLWEIERLIWDGVWPA